jgi:hypothetical protein
MVEQAAEALQSHNERVFEKLRSSLAADAATDSQPGGPAAQVSDGGGRQQTPLYFNPSTGRGAVLTLSLGRRYSPPARP